MSTSLEKQQDNKRLSVGSAIAVGLVGAGVSTGANATAIIDSSPIVTDLNDTKPQMIDTGTAMLGLVLVAVIFMMFRRVLR